jgi:hypothetical protein
LRKAVVIEAEGGEDKDSTGHRVDTASILEGFKKEGWEAYTLFYKDSKGEELFKQIVDLGTVVYVSRIDPGKYEDYTEEKYLVFLRRLIDAGLLGSTEPETTWKMGTKQILYQLRNTKIGSRDVEIYKNRSEFEKKFYDSLLRCPEGRVLKQNRGAGGRGVFWVCANSNPVKFLCREARDASLKIFDEWKDFIDFISSSYLIGEKSMLINMPYYKNVKDGEVRVIMTQEIPICIEHKHPKPDENGNYFSCTKRAGCEIEYIYDFNTIPEWKGLTEVVVEEIPQLQSILEVANLPHLWTIDFIKNDSGQYLLGEINCLCYGYITQTKVGYAMVESIVRKFK